MLQAQPERPGFYFLSCPDAQILQEAVEEKARAFAPAGAPFKRVCFWGDEPPPDAFWECLSVRDLFGSVRLVLVRQAHLWNTATWKLLDKMLSRPLPGSFPVFCLENEWEKNKMKVPAVLSKVRCLKFATKQGWLWSNPGVTDRTVQGYVTAQAKARGITLAPRTLATLCENTPRQAGVLAAELDKLALLAETGKPVQPELLATAEWSPEAQAFACIDHLMRGNARGVWAELARMTDLEGQAMGLLGLLAWKFRSLWQVLVGDAAPRYGLSLELAQSVGHERLATAMNLVLDAEAAIKTGTSPRQTVELTFSNLLDVLSPKQSMRGSARR